MPIAQASGTLLAKAETTVSQAKNGSKLNRQLLDDLLEALELGSLCALGGGLPLGVRNILEYFDDELKEYFE